METSTKETILASDEKEHVCPHCKRVVPKETMTSITGRTISFKPMCECEKRAFEEEMLIRQEEEQREREKQWAKERVEQFDKHSTMGPRFQRCSFDNFKIRPGTEIAYEQAKRYAENFDESDTSLFLWGTYGGGKSHLAAAVANGLRANYKTVIFTSVPDLLQKIRSTFRKNNEDTEEKLFKAFMNCDLLILDDLGSEKSSDWTQDVLFRLIDGRYKLERPTLYTSNIHPSKMESDPSLARIYDRIVETSLIIQLKASSYREELAKDRYEAIKRSTSL